MALCHHSFCKAITFIYSGQIVFGRWMIKTAALENYCRAFSSKAHKKGKILMEGTFSEFAKLAGRWFYLRKPKMCPLNTRRSPMGLSVHGLKFLNQFWCQRMACGSRSDFTLLFHYAVDTLINSNTYQTLPIRIPLQTHHSSTLALSTSFKQFHTYLQLFLSIDRHLHNESAVKSKVTCGWVGV